MVRVPAPGAMDDETFRKHLQARHIPEGDFADLIEFYPSNFRLNRPTYQTYHDHLHRTKDYGHQHKP